jgi:murein DD-endopeptidase MepM/ murein hydrolase activator NlpD
MLKRPLSRTTNAIPGDGLFAKQAWIRARERIESRPRINLLVHVSSYARNRDGTATQVSEHTRAWPGQGGGTSAGKLPPMGSPVGREPKLRGCDGEYGCGYYGAPRTDRNRKPLPPHKGVDVVTTPGEPVNSPVAGTVVTPFDPYDSDTTKRGKLSAIQIKTDDGHIVEVLYVDSKSAGLKKGDNVEIGTPIGTAQDLSTVYPPKGKDRMTNHVDIRIKDKNGVYHDPTPHIRGRR